MKNKLLKGVAVIITGTLLTGCERGMPDCDSPEIQDMLISQIKRSLYDDDTQVTVTDAESVYHDRDVKLRVCKANLKLNNKIEGDFAFSYRIQYLDLENRVFEVIVYPSEQM